MIQIKTFHTMALSQPQHPSSQSPIGMFDSGVGGISVLQHVRAALPHEDLVYLADSFHAPYGNKTPEDIQARAMALTQFLVTQGCKAVVIACNTATAAAAGLLRATFDIPIIGMEPAVKPAANATKSGVIGVLATTGTLKSAQFAGLLEHYGQHVQVVTQACIGLVECIEKGELATAHTRQLLERYLHPLLDAGADTIVLGCTHYPFVKEAIADIVGHQVSLIDTGAAVARHLQHRLEDAHLEKLPQIPTLDPELAAHVVREPLGNVQFWSNSPSVDADKVIATLWGQPIKLQALRV